MRGGPQDGGTGDEATDEALRALAEPRRRAIQTAIALGGAVVSKPIAKKTT